MKSRSVPVRSGRRREDRRERGREGCESYIDTEVDAEKEKVRGGKHIACEPLPSRISPLVTLAILEHRRKGR